MIQARHLVKIYPMGTTEVRALDGVSLQVEPGEFVALVGASGSGKSTMMHVLGCLDRPTGGTYHLLDEQVSDMTDRQLSRIRNAKIGFVFQTFNLIRRMSAWENVAAPLFYARQAVTKPRAMEALERVGLADRAKHAPNELSGGERQRVAIARAIVNNPALVLADEPTGNLDTRTGEQIMNIFHELHQAGTTVILVTHEQGLAARAQRIVDMRDGKIISDRLNDGASKVSPATADSIHIPGAARAELPDADTESTEDERESVLHPNAKRAWIWALLGPGFLVGLFCWAKALTLVQEMNPNFVSTVGQILWIALAVMVFVAPVMGIIQGRRGARWVRVAPAKYTGLKRAVAAQWLGGIHLVSMTLLLGLIALALVLKTKGLLPPR